MERATDRSMTGVIGMTLASGWIGAGLNRLTGRRHEMESPGALVWLVTPLASVIVSRLLRRNSAPSGWSPGLLGTLPWYGVGATLFPAVTVASLRFGRSMGWVDDTPSDQTALSQSTARGIATSIPKNVFEEAVWRGYLTSELHHRGMSDTRVDLAVGLVWGLWHLPYYLFFLPEDDIRNVLDVPRERFASIAVATMMAWTPPYSELHRLSGSIWPCVLMHSVEDGFVNALTLEGHASIQPDRKALISPVIGLIPSALYLAAGLAMRRFRHRTH